MHINGFISQMLARDSARASWIQFIVEQTTAAVQQNCGKERTQIFNCDQWSFAMHEALDACVRMERDRLRYAFSLESKKRINVHYYVRLIIDYIFFYRS